MKRFVRPLVLMVAVGVLGGCGQSDKDLAALDRPALTKMAEQGDPRAQTLLGEKYMANGATESDYKQAFAWTRKAPGAVSSI